jgi:hypothetical protein
MVKIVSMSILAMRCFPLIVGLVTFYLWETAAFFQFISHRACCISNNRRDPSVFVQGGSPHKTLLAVDTILLEEPAENLIFEA